MNTCIFLHAFARIELGVKNQSLVHLLKPGMGVQWMMGDALLISPVVNDTEDTVTAYFPDGEWINLYDNSLLTSTAGYHVLSVRAFCNASVIFSHFGRASTSF